MVEPQSSTEFAGQRVTVMGLGRFGGGVGVTRFLADRGADVLVTDLEPADRLVASLVKIQDLIDSGVVSLRLGEHNVSDFTTCDLVVVNPAVKPGNRFVRAAEAAGIEVTTEIRLLVQRLPNRLRTIGVTGSAGKSTVTAMIGHVLGKYCPGRAWVGGNIGVSLLPYLDQIDSTHWVVLELSSFMLHRLRADDSFAGWSPGIAVVTNISENHIDWHGSFEEYQHAKQVILEYQQPGDKVVLDQSLSDWPVAEGVRLDLVSSTYALHTYPLGVPGEHNQRNAVFVATLGENIAIGHGCMVMEQLADFPGLPHRLQLVAERNGVRYFNDSKCTTPEAARLAIDAFVTQNPDQNGDSPRFVHLILGGKDKGSDMSALAAFVSERCRAVYTIGALGDTLARLIEDAASRSVSDRPTTCGGVNWPAETAEVVRCGEIDKAVAEIQMRVQPGDVVLLSPACASWDQFENYEQRGERFIELVDKPTD